MPIKCEGPKDPLSLADEANTAYDNLAAARAAYTVKMRRQDMALFVSFIFDVGLRVQAARKGEEPEPLEKTMTVSMEQHLGPLLTPENIDGDPVVQAARTEFDALCQETYTALNSGQQLAFDLEGQP